MMPPTIVAFSVSPSSGTAPYVAEAEFENAVLIDGVIYSLELFGQVTVGSCILGMVSVNNSVSGANAILNTGTYSFDTDVPSGRCRTHSLVIRDLRTNKVVDYKNIYIDNT